ncbi:MAG: hypothetical protein F8N15_07030 [Methanobacterium sp.]|nr:hypothetical protein [Methanobacterium sp.]
MLETQDLQGKWQSPEIETVNNPDGSVMYIQREATFKGDEWSIRIRSYLDKNGEEPFFTIHAKGNYILSGESSYVNQAACVDFNNTGRFVTAHHTALVDMLNEVSFDTEWNLDEEHDVSINGCALVPSIDNCPVEYDIIQVKENKIYFGEFTPDQKEDIQKLSRGDIEPSEDSAGICSVDNRPRQLMSYPLVKS